jgi:dienelactone hydrolase
MKNLVLVLLASLLIGCVQIDYRKWECGKVWGSERFVRKNDFDNKYLVASERGYLYALAGALVLQKDNLEGQQHFFPDVPRMIRVERLSAHNRRSGFEAQTFEVRETADSPVVKEIVIAFAGSNDVLDWLQNFNFLDKRQYKEARDYVRSVANSPEYRGARFVVAGFSLGGALAVHVTKHRDTSDYIAEAWAFNPSPKTWVHGDVDQRIWLAAHVGEAVGVIRRAPFRILPGISAIGAPSDQVVDKYYLIKTNRIYGHFRWVLPVQMLHVADFAIRERALDPDEETEPLKILRDARMGGDRPCY